jgi:hypothetical protein
MMATSRCRELINEWPDLDLPSRVVAHLVRRPRTGINTAASRRIWRRMDERESW